MNIREVASAIDGLVLSLDLLAQQYAAEAERNDVEYRAEHRGHEHPVYANRAQHVRAAVGSRVYLARLLGLAPVSPPVGVASVQPKE